MVLALSIGVYALIMATIFWVTQKRVKTIADFVSANGQAGRYLITVAHGMTGLAAISIIAGFEIYFQAGFTASWWYTMMIPVGMIIALSGWVNYRFRETGCLTMPQFLERRYSRKFRVFSGSLAFCAGVLNCGIFPAVTARFFMVYGDLPDSFALLGMDWSTFHVLMATQVILAVTMAIGGGQMTIMLTDFFQGILLLVGFVAVAVYGIHQLGFGAIFDSLANAPGAAQLIDPLLTRQGDEVSVWFFGILALQRFYGHMAWQGGTGYFAAAKSPFEFRMAGILGEWRQQAIFIMYALIPIIIWAMMQNAGFSVETAQTEAMVAALDDEYTRNQMVVPAGLAQFLPVWLYAFFFIIMIGATISTDNSVYHSYGTIFVQDVLIPFTGMRVSVEKNIGMIRCAIVLVGCFAFVWSSIFPLRDYIMMYFALTSTVLIGGAGCAIIGGLYWRRGTTRGAWWGMITGSSLSVIGILLRGFWPSIPGATRLAENFPINGAWMSLIAMICAISAYIIASLTEKTTVDLEAVLNRDPRDPSVDKPKWTVSRAIGITHEFKRGDKIIYLVQIGWMLGWCAVFLVGTFLGLNGLLTQEHWLLWWKFFVVIGMIVSVIVAVWFSIGGVRNVFELLESIKTRDAAEAAESGNNPS